jgi:hypothetical protein
MDQTTQPALQRRATLEATPEARGSVADGESDSAAKRGYWRLSGASLRAPFVIFLLVSFATLLSIVFLSTLSRGLWEDGYFLIRFARNFWRHGTLSWNVADGPVYGMTSQTLQLLGAALHPLTPRHMVLGLKAACCVALFAALPVAFSAVKSPSAASSSRGVVPPPLGATAGLMPLVVGLSSAPILEAMLTGLETVIGLLVVAMSVVAIFKATDGVRDRVFVIAAMLGVYFTRPDAVLIPVVLLGARWLWALRERAGGSASAGKQLRALTWTFAGFGAGMLILLATFHLYYGTALPLPFYIKTHGITVQPADYIVYFEAEKTGNALQAALFAFPFFFVALHDRSRVVLALMLSGAAFCGYHYFATIETMGYMSRFYLPGLVPIFIAAGLAYPAYQLRRRWVVSALVYLLYVAACVGLKRFDTTPPPLEMYVPALVATGVMLLGPVGYNAVSALGIGSCLVVGAALNYPIVALAFEDDETVLLRQIRRRAVFNGIEQLRGIAPKVVYHTDMGAPGVLFPEAKVVDLDGLLNEDITLRGKPFEELCQADRPDAIYVPNEGYAQLRREILSSECLKGYRAVTSMKHAPLHIRKDLVRSYRRSS